MTPRPERLLRTTSSGLFCPPGDFHIDPTRAVGRAVITHGHADHARSGHDAVLATAETLAIMRSRFGEGFAAHSQALRYGETLRLGAVEVSLHPAGHVLGSAQIRLEWQGLRIVVSGDYKRRRDPTCPAFTPVPCDVFVTEATFGLPVFRHPPDTGEIEKLLASHALFSDRAHLVGAYTLGKAQRLIMLLREAGYDRPIYCHGALEPMNALYAAQGLALGDLKALDRAKPADLEGEIILAPPSALSDRGSRKMGNAVRAFASGWMSIRARARQQAVELPLVISDHADWDELTDTIDALAPAEIWVTHGNEEALVHWARSKGRRARPLTLSGRGEDGEAG
jgi:putative mRNA 3-end processing factor